MRQTRPDCGVFVPVRSLPSPYGSGGFGQEAKDLIDLFSKNGIRYWQVFPFTYSYDHIFPYEGQSSFAKNHLLLDPDQLVSDGLLEKVPANPNADQKHIKQNVLPWKRKLLATAYIEFKAGKSTHLQSAFKEFVIKHERWALDFALYVALRDYFKGKPWQRWPKEVRDRQPYAMQTWEIALHDPIKQELFCQFILDLQWQRLREYAHAKNVSIIGDLPIYSAIDSAETWQHRDLFRLKPSGDAAQIGGAPADIFSTVGQVWVVPVYNWTASKHTGHAYILDRIRAQFETFDLLRLDHFLGYIRHWVIPAGKSFNHGRWVYDPGAPFLTKLKRLIAPEKFILDDLGTKSNQAEQEIRRFKAPVMRVLTMELHSVQHFYQAFDYRKPTVAHTSTHDSDTILGWYEKRPAAFKRALAEWWNQQQLTHLPLQFRFIAPLLKSRARLVIVPMQDVLGLGSEARLNVPGVRNTKNWTWRVTREEIDTDLFSLLGSLIKDSRSPRGE